MSQNCNLKIYLGENAVGYMYTRVRFNWDEVDYSMYSTFLFMINILGEDKLYSFC